MADAKSTLIVADERELIREGLAALCERSNRFEILALCRNGAEALELVCHRKPDLCVLALDLPELHPFELMASARSRLAMTRIAILADRYDRKTVLEALRAGACAFLLRNGPVRDILDGLDQMAKGGIYLSPSVKTDRVFGNPGVGEADDPMDRLSAREFQVFSLLVEGIRAKEIANRLNLSPKTVDSHRKNLMHKLGIHDVAGLVRFSLSRETA